MRKCLLFLLLVHLAVTGLAQQPSNLIRIKAALPKIKDSLRYTDALNRMAMLLYEKNVDSTFYYTRQARAIAKRHNYDKGEADALNNLGVFFDIKGNLQLALRYYNEAYDDYRKINDSSNCVQTTMNIAMVYNEIGKKDRAIQHFNKALKEGGKLKQDSILSLVIYNYLLEFPNQFSRESNNYYIARAKKIAAKYDDQRCLIAIDQLVADEMIARGERQKGIELLKRTIDAAIAHNLYYVSMDMLIDIGDQFSSINPERAVAYYTMGLNIAHQNGYLIYSQLIARKLFDFYTARRDRLKAAQYSKQLLVLRDEQDKLDNASSIDYLDYALKDEQVRSLTLRSGYQTALLILALLLCALAIAGIIIIRRHLKQTRLLNKLITGQNEEMKRALDALEQSQKDNTRMMKIVAHDLRNPIGAMHSIATMMLDDEGRSENDRMLLELIRASGQNSLELVSDLLQVQFKIEGLKKAPVNLEEMLKYCVSLLYNKAEAKGQQINLESTPVRLNASGEKLWRVISNLIGNAIKFSPTGSSIDIKMERRPDMVRIAVKDEGIGIPPEMQEKIFDMFTEAKRPGTAGEQAFGLGLAISKQIVEAHNGRIWLESAVGKGTTFFVDLPLSDS